MIVRQEEIDAEKLTRDISRIRIVSKMRSWTSAFTASTVMAGIPSSTNLTGLALNAVMSTRGDYLTYPPKIATTISSRKYKTTSKSL